MVQVWRYVTLVLAALLAGMTFCHVLEAPAKMQYPAALYLTLHRTLYVAFGPPNVGVFIEMGAIVAGGILVFMIRRRPGFWSALLGTASLLAGLGMYFALVEPANVALRAMAVESPPQDWTVWRDQWEAGHTMHFLLDFIGLTALIWSVLPGAPRQSQTLMSYAEMDRPTARSR